MLRSTPQTGPVATVLGSASASSLVPQIFASNVHSILLNFLNQKIQSTNQKVVPKLRHGTLLRQEVSFFLGSVTSLDEDFVTRKNL